MGLLGFSHVGIGVSDLDRSVRFYRDVLGFAQLYALDVGNDEVAATMEQAGAFRSAMLRRDDVRVELLQWVDVPVQGAGRRPMTSLGLTHLSFRVSDVDALSAAVRAAGGSVHEQTLSVLGSGPGAVRLMYVTDPDGTRIEFMANVPDLATFAAPAVLDLPS